MVDLQFPSSIKEACELLASRPGAARIIAGGVSLMILIRHQLFFPDLLISLKRIASLDRIEFNEKEGLRIGALVTHHQIETSSIVRQYYPALAECTHQVGNLRLRNMGTLMGDLCQGDNHSDPAPLLTVLGAIIKVRSSKGERQLSMAKFHSGIYENTLEEGEIATEILIPSPQKQSRTVYLRFAGNSSLDWPMISVAASIAESGKFDRELKLSVGCLAEVPINLTPLGESLMDKKLTLGNIRKFAESCASRIEPLPDDRGTVWYKKRLAAVYIRRAVEQLVR